MLHNSIPGTLKVNAHRNQLDVYMIPRSETRPNSWRHKNRCTPKSANAKTRYQNEVTHSNRCCSSPTKQDNVVSEENEANRTLHKQRCSKERNKRLHINTSSHAPRHAPTTGRQLSPATRTHDRQSCHARRHQQRLAMGTTRKLQAANDFRKKRTRESQPVGVNKCKKRLVTNMEIN